MKVAAEKSLSRHANLTGMPLHSLGQYGTALDNSVSKLMNHELAALNLNNTDFTPDQTILDRLGMDALRVSRDTADGCTGNKSRREQTRG